MSASAWAFFNQAKKQLGEASGGIRLDSGIFRLSLHTSAAAITTTTDVSTLASIGSEITAQGGYVAGGRTLGGVAWTINGASVKWDTSDLVFTASGADLTNVKFAVIHYSAAAASGPTMLWSKLSTAQFTVASGNTLTIQMAAAGVFTLT
jgi:hypothetical protein